MLQYLKQTIKHSAVYSFANVLQKGVGFLMIPVYTHFLSPAEYGVLEMMDLTMMVLSMMTGYENRRRHHPFLLSLRFSGR
jgi:O-antigen/teichoic acid export membrane protein